MKRLIFVLICVALLMPTSCQRQQNDMHLEYLTEPCLIPTKDNKFKLCSDLIIKVYNQYHAIPRGFKTDLASIPRLMRPIYSPAEYDSIAPSVVHDWHYCCVKEVSRANADGIFYQGLRLQGMGMYKAFAYWVGVRSMGWLYYKHGTDMIEHIGEYADNAPHGVFIDVNDTRLG